MVDRSALVTLLSQDLLPLLTGAQSENGHGTRIDVNYAINSLTNIR